MWLLVLASLLWAPSFPLIKQLGIDPDLLSALRLVLAAVAFVSWRGSGTDHGPLGSGRRVRLLALGAVQLGLMYLLVHRAYDDLQGHEVALATMLTPLWVATIDGALERRLRWRPFAAAALACAAALVLARLDVGDRSGRSEASALTRGFLLVQAANVCFALGQVVYRRMDRSAPLPHVTAFRWLYLGAALVAVSAAPFLVSEGALSAVAARPAGDLAVLLYLGLVPTALGFHLWNRGATRVSAGVLAAANDLKVPLAVAVALMPPFREPADPVRLVTATVLISAALWLGREPRSADAAR
jgi:drug/metabolite transporter (DMT)-like permease